MAAIQYTARAIYESRNGSGCKPWARLSRDHQAPYLKDAVAAFDVIRNAALEEAASVADARDLSIMSSTVVDAEARKIAAAIRALKESGDD